MKNKKGLFWIATGLLLIAAALCLTIRNFQEERNAEVSAKTAVQQLEGFLPTQAPTDPSSPTPGTPLQTLPAEETEIPDYILDPSMEMPVRNLDGQDYIAILEVPTLELTLPIISQWSYSALKIAPCRYAGSAYTDDLILAGHNYRVHFGPLRNLKPGDPLILTDMDGNRFTYEVALVEILEPTAVEEMKSGGWDLSLFTCTLGGQSRITIRCQRTEP